MTAQMCIQSTVSDWSCLRAGKVAHCYQAFKTRSLLDL